MTTHPYDLIIGLDRSDQNRFGVGRQLVPLHTSIQRPDFAETLWAWPPLLAGED